jgi:DNA transformation protein
MAAGRDLDIEHIRELFESFRPVEVRSMFGGAGIAADGIIFAILFDGVIYLKTDEATIPAFEREGSTPFVYTRMKTPRVRKKPSTFWQMPEQLYDDPDELATWAARSFAIAQRKKAAGKPPGKKSPAATPKPARNPPPRATKRQGSARKKQRSRR